MHNAIKHLKPKMLNYVAIISKIAYTLIMRAKELRRMLAAKGATFEWGKGSHLHVLLNGRQSILPMHSGKDIGIGLLKAIERDLAIRLR
jgi:mRNA interferase HicA